MAIAMTSRLRFAEGGSLADDGGRYMVGRTPESYAKIRTFPALWVCDWRLKLQCEERQG
jgi:hypothetical protein